MSRYGHAGASWQLATTVALLVLACATPVWLRGYLTIGVGLLVTVGVLALGLRSAPRTAG